MSSPGEDSLLQCFIVFLMSAEVMAVVSKGSGLCVVITSLTHDGMPLYPALFCLLNDVLKKV